MSKAGGVGDGGGGMKPHCSSTLLDRIPPKRPEPAAGDVPVLSDAWLDSMRREHQEEDPPPPHVIRAMSKIAIYAATYGSTSMYLRDPVVAVPIGIVQEWLKEYGFEFDGYSNF